MAVTTQAKSTFRGETKTFRVTFTRQSDGALIDLSTDVTGIEFEIATDVGQTPLISKSIGSGITVLAQTGATLGQADIVLDASDTDSLAPGVYKYDLVVVLTTTARHYAVPPSPFTVREVVNAL